MSMILSKVVHTLWTCICLYLMGMGDEGGLTRSVVADSEISQGSKDMANSKSDVQEKSTTKYPHIILIIADDLGFNDVSFHGSPQIPTPNLDALAFSGIILNNYYVSPICTPSRSALFTGKHPIHTGMQENVIYGTTPYGLSLDEKLLPEYLKDFNYSTHLVGKWHLGHFRRAYTPTCRGFDSHFGHWTGHKDYYDNMAQESNPQAWGYDTRRNLEVSYDHWGKYTTDIYTEEAVSVIRKHKRYFGDSLNNSQPLFLTLSHTAVHSANPYKLLQAPQDEVSKFSHVKDPNRRTYAAMVSKLDESVGKIVKELGDQGMLKDSMIIFTTDNGGPAAGFNGNAASNWPLRGVKNTLYEGGVRGASFIWSPLLKSFSRVSGQMMHIQDWLPTIMAAIGEDLKETSQLDGVSIWDAFNDPQLPSPRTQFLHNIDDSYGNEGIRYREWKLMHGTTYEGKWDGWYGPSGFEPQLPHPFYNSTGATITAISLTQTANNTDHAASKNDVALQNQYSYLERSDAGRAIQNLEPGLWPNISVWANLAQKASIYCNKSEHTTTSCDLKSGEYCLFNVEKDPCERNNMAKIMPSLVNELKELLDTYKKTAVPPRNMKKDPRGEPKFWNYTWTNWVDFVEPLTPNQLGTRLVCS